MYILNAVLIDDEQSNIDLLSHDLAAYCPMVLIKDTFTNPDKALVYLSTNKIDVIFLDISMPSMTGFEFLAAQTNINYQIIFVTAHQDYALAAFDFYAVAYLLKPVSKEKLLAAVNHLNITNKNTDLLSIEMMLRNFQNEEIKTIALPTLEGFEMVALKDIIYLAAEGNYTEIFLKVNQKILISKNLKEFEKILPNKSFTRIHNSYMIQNTALKRYLKGDGGNVIMENGAELPVSRANKLKLLNMLTL